MQKVFLDTNIVLDFLDKKREKHEKAKILISKLVKENSQIVISEDMLSTIFYISKEKKRVLQFFEVIVEKWSVVYYGTSLISEAIALCQKKEGQDLEDTLQCLCAKEQTCNYIVTSDKRFVDCGIQVIGYDEVVEF